MNSSDRNYGIEFGRIIAMILVVVCHYTIHCGWAIRYAAPGVYASGAWNSLMLVLVQLGQMGVSFFFIVTGYFMLGKSLSFSHIVKTWAQVLLYSLTAAFLVLSFWLFFGKVPHAIDALLTQDQLPTTLIKSLTPVLGVQYWFVSAYVCLIVISPVLNRAISSLTRRSYVLLLLFFLLLSLWPLYTSRGAYWNSLVYAVAAYCIGAGIRSGALRLSCGGGYRWQAAFACVVLLFLGFLFNYVALSGAPAARWFGWLSQAKDGIRCIPLLLAVILFLLVREMRFPRGFIPLVRLMAPATFGVYLVHENLFGYRILWDHINNIVSAPSGPLARIATILIVSLLVYSILSLAVSLFDRIVTKRVVFLATSAARNVSSRIL